MHKYALAINLVLLFELCNCFFAIIFVYFFTLYRMNNETLQIFQQIKKPNLLYKIQNDEKIEDEIKNFDQQDRFTFLCDKIAKNNCSYILKINKRYLNNTENRKICAYLRENKNYTVLNVFFRRFEQTKEFIEQFVTDQITAIIAGEYFIKHGFATIESKNIEYIIFSYLCEYDLTLHDHFERFMLEHGDFIDVSVIANVFGILMQNVANDRDISRIQKSFYAHIDRYYDNRQSSSAEKDSKAYTCIFKLLLVHDKFFKANNFVNLLHDKLLFENMEDLSAFVKLYNHAPGIFVNVSDDILLSYAINADEKHFRALYPTLRKRKDIRKNRAYDILAFLCKHYNIKFDLPATETITAEYLIWWDIHCAKTENHSKKDPAAPNTISAGSKDLTAPRPISAGFKNPAAPRPISAGFEDPAALRPISAGFEDPAAPSPISAGSEDFTALSPMSAGSIDLTAPRPISAGFESPAAASLISSGFESPAAASLISAGFEFSDQYINGFSFLDNLCANKSNYVSAFINNNRHARNKIYENEIQKHEFDCFLKYLKNENSNKYDCDVKNLMFTNPNLTERILFYLSQKDLMYKEIQKIENISKFNKKLLLLETEKLIKSYKNVDFVQKYVISKKNLFYNCSYKQFCSDYKNKYKGIVYDLLYKHCAKGVLQSKAAEEESCTNTGNLAADNKVKHDKTPIEVVNVPNSEDKDIVHEDKLKTTLMKEDGQPKDILYFMNNDIEVTCNYTITNTDNIRRIEAKSISTLINMICEQNKQGIVDLETCIAKNIVFIVNLFASPHFLSNLITGVFEFFKHQKSKSCLPFIAHIVENTNFDIENCKCAVKQIVNAGNFDLFTVFLARLSVDKIYKAFLYFENDKLADILHKIVENKLQSGCNDANLIIDMIKNESTISYGIDLAIKFGVRDSKLIETIYNIMENKNVFVHSKKQTTDFCVKKHKSAKSNKGTQAVSETNKENAEEPNITYNYSDDIIYKGLTYLSKNKYEFDNDFLCNLFFKRSKLDEIGQLILENIKTQPNHLTELCSVFFLNPIKSLGFMQRLVNNGLILTNEIAFELISLIKNVYDDEDRKIIVNLLNKHEFNDKKTMNLHILKHLSNNNTLSKFCLLKILEKNYYNDFDVFLHLNTILANETDFRLNKYILKILKTHKCNFYNVIFDWKENKKVRKLLFKVYLLVAKDDIFFAELKKEYKNCDEFETILEFYNVSA